MDTQMELFKKQENEPETDTPKGLLWLCTGLVAGAALMYFTDERGGARRRAFVRDKSFKWQRLGLMFLDKRTRDLGNRIYGFFVEKSHAMRERSAQIDDQILIERIRAKVGRVVSHPKMIHITSENGRVTLTGYSLKSEMPRMYECVRSVRGVRGVVNRVEAVAGERQMSFAAGAVANAHPI